MSEAEKKIEVLGCSVTGCEKPAELTIREAESGRVVCFCQAHHDELFPSERFSPAAPDGDELLTRMTTALDEVAADQGEEPKSAPGDETAVVTPFDRAIGAVLGEREYQEKLWGPTEMQGRHNVTEFLVFIQDYVNEALHVQSRIASPHAEDKTLPIMRKIAGLAIACMEQNGVRSRDISDLQKKRQEHCAEVRTVKVEEWPCDKAREKDGRQAVADERVDYGD